LRCIAPFHHLWGSLAEVGCLPVISNFPDCLLIPNGGRICRAWGFAADRSEFRVTPYNVDKLFWLIGSGNFYEDPHVGNRGRIGSKKKEFIEVAKAQLEERQTPIEGGAR
jgi:hypothetical protein